MKRTGRFLKGCQRHGLSKTPEYRAWLAMHRRCSHDYWWPAGYYDRGIAVVQEWHDRDGLFRFLKHVGKRPIGCSLDRINTNQGYAPGNVRWADKNTQIKNRRKACSLGQFSTNDLMCELGRRGEFAW